MSNIINKIPGVLKKMWDMISPPEGCPQGGVGMRRHLKIVITNHNRKLAKKDTDESYT
jgi:hypothetical protein